MNSRKAIVFLGGGRITRALVAGLRLAHYRRRIVVYDHNPRKLSVLAREARVEIARDLKTAIAGAEMLVIAVRPASVAGLLKEVKDTGEREGLCVSLAAGIPLKNLRTGLSSARWVRAMPSPVCRVGRGLTALCFDRNAREADRTRVRGFFEAVGSVVELPEVQFDVFTATYSSSHGYHALAALAAAAGKAGLDRKTALMAAGHALGDAILYWRESGLSLEKLLQEAATPGGIAAATMAAMDRTGYARVVALGLNAGISRARQTAKGRG